MRKPCFEPLTCAQSPRFMLARADAFENSSKPCLWKDSLQWSTAVDSNGAPTVFIRAPVRGSFGRVKHECRMSVSASAFRCQGSCCSTDGSLCSQLFTAWSGERDAEGTVSHQRWLPTKEEKGKRRNVCLYWCSYHARSNEAEAVASCYLFQCQLASL